MEVKWDDRFATGVHLIDTQHKRLIQNINKLTKALELGRPNMEVAKILEYLTKYTQSHFNTEEKYMQKYKYPEYEFHKKEHKNFLKTLQELKNLFLQDPYALETAKSVQYELWIYFKEHVSVIDASLGTFLISRNVE